MDTNAIYHYIQWYDVEPELLIDITNFQEKKLKAIMAYNSAVLQS